MLESGRGIDYESPISYHDSTSEEEKKLSSVKKLPSQFHTQERQENGMELAQRFNEYMEQLMQVDVESDRSDF